MGRRASLCCLHDRANSEVQDARTHAHTRACTQAHELLRHRFFRSPSTGLWLFYRLWLPAGGEPRGVVFLSHGFGEHVGRYERFAAGLARAGYAPWRAA